MSLEERPVSQIRTEYKKAIAWVESIIPNIPPNSRIYEYLKVLEENVTANIQGTILIKPTLLILETHQQSDLLIEIHKKFHNRKDKVFIDKLRESLLGPIYSHKEELGEGPAKSNFGRDIESEFFMATRALNPNIVTFGGNDVVYNLEYFKFGIEVKRIHSLENISSQMIKGCQQIEENHSIRYGMVAFRFDKHFFIVNELNELELIDRQENILTFKTKKECEDSSLFQANSFLKKYGPNLLKLAKNYPKVQGICAFCLLPCKLEGSDQAMFSANVSSAYVARDIKSEAVMRKIVAEFDPRQKR